jgi:hypothetical protein
VLAAAPLSLLLRWARARLLLLAIWLRLGRLVLLIVLRPLLRARLGRAPLLAAALLGARHAALLGHDAGSRLTPPSRPMP